MAVFMWRWVYGSLDADEYDTLQAAASAEAHQDGEWSCVGVEVVDGGVSTWMPRGEGDNPFEDAVAAVEAAQDAAWAAQREKEKERPVTGIVRVAAPDAGDFKPDRWARMELVHDADEESEAVTRLARIFGVDRVSVERMKVRA